MVDQDTVCCMCGDIGFPDKLFRCTKCNSRFQHSYCSNYYEESSEASGLCNWCKCEEINARNPIHSKKTAGKDAGTINRSEYSGEKIKQKDKEENGDKGKNMSPAPSPKTGGRRYKLLKDVMC